MSYDGTVVKAVACELQQILTGARIDKIQQPNRHELVLVLRQPGRSYRLLLSTLAQEAGVYLTTQSKSNPAQAPLFCMVMRKHLEGGRIISVTQPDLERIIEITCEIIDELGDLARRQLIIEIMGKHSNIILIEPRANRIIEAIHRVTPAISRYRIVAPGQTYLTPPPQDKILPWACEADSFAEKLFTRPLKQAIAKALLACFSGLGPQTVDELLYRADIEPTLALEYFGDYELNKLWQSFSQAAQDIRANRFYPEVIRREGTPLTFSALALTGVPSESRLAFVSINEALDYFYSHKTKTDTYRQKIADLAGLVQKEIDRCEKKAGLQAETIHEKKQLAHLCLWGELLTANIHTLSPATEVEVVNFYEPDCPSVRIPLDEKLSIAENAQRYFQRYQRARRAAEQAQGHYAETRQELDYLYSLAASLDNVTSLEEAEEIRAEIIEAGYLKVPPPKRPSSAKAKAKAQSKTPAAVGSQPQRIVLDGWEIYIGKNNKQNDLLVTKTAKPEDLWLHTKDIPGSHVIIKNPRGLVVPDHILEQAALLAAYHSKARLSVNVPVDYTQKKYVRKQKGAKPGMVHYDNQRTVYITPDAARVKAILESKTAPNP